MYWKRSLQLGAALLLGGVATQAQAQAPRVTGILPPPPAPVFVRAQAQPAPDTTAPGSTDPGSATPSPQQLQAATQGQDAPGNTEEPPLGPTPLDKVGILQGLLFGDQAAESKIKFSGWLDFDYTYRSSGPGQNNIAPVMNRFGDEALARQLGLDIYKPLDKKEWDWGFNIIAIGGADAAFLNPTAGWYDNRNPRFGFSFTDLNVTFHAPILTEGGVDFKIGRQTTCLGPMGALPWQRYFDSSDYAWYNEEEGRYTGVSANWYITKQLSWYNGIEVGGWGVFFDDPARGVDYLTQINYWLDEDAKKTKVWTTLLTGPTGFTSNGNTTVVELGLQHNYNKYLYQIIDSQLTYSKAPIFFTPRKGYQERAYDVYTYLGAHVSPTVDVNSRFEWYEDVDGGGYPGGFGIPHTHFFETTLGIDYHPNKWLQFRPEIRYDYATNPRFGENYNNKSQLSLAAEVLIKF